MKAPKNRIIDKEQYYTSPFAAKSIIEELQKREA